MRDVCLTAWDNKAFALCGIKFSTADNKVFREAIAQTRVCPDFTLNHAQIMSTTRLDQLSTTANRFKDSRLKAGLQYGLLITSNGWHSVARRSYHNYILISVEGPIFICLNNVTGERAHAEDIKNDFEKQFAALGDEIVQRILIGVTDTPTANQKAWRLLEIAYPKQFWIGCAAHEVSLLFKEWIKKTPEMLTLFKEGHRFVKWVKNHFEILKLFREIFPKHL